MENYGRVKIITRENLLTLDLTGTKDTIKCNQCSEVKVIPFPFSSVEVEQVSTLKNGKKTVRKVRITDRKNFLKWFLEVHYGKHMRGE